MRHFATSNAGDAEAERDSIIVFCPRQISGQFFETASHIRTIGLLDYISHAGYLRIKRKLF